VSNKIGQLGASQEVQHLLDSTNPHAGKERNSKEEGLSFLFSRDATNSAV